MDHSIPDVEPKLKRALGVRALVLYGLVLTQPTAPMPCYGVVCVTAKGHVVTAILVGMLAMLLTAISYGRMAKVYPSAGSAYTYVGRELHPVLGYLTGWAMIFDYVMNPIICSIWCSKAATKLDFLPRVPFAVWAVSFVLLFTFSNVRGIEASARTNQWIATGLGIVIVWFLAAAARYLWTPLGSEGLSLLRPFYDAHTFSFSDVSTGTSIAVLTYIGFDAVSTLSEEARDPRRDIVRATVLTCLLVGVLAAIEVYAAQLVWPAWEFADKETAISQIAERIGGEPLMQTLTLALLIATMGSGIGSHLAAGRLLYSMGRDGVLPARFFGSVDPKSRIPRNNVLLVGVLSLVGVFLLDYDTGAELLNFGAFIGFMGVNLSALMRYSVRLRGMTEDARASTAARWLHAAPPLVGFLVCLFLWLSLKSSAKVVGMVWLGIGLGFGAWQSRGFTLPVRGPEPGREWGGDP